MNKNTFAHLAFMSFLLLCFFACSKKDNSTPVSDSFELKAKFNGTEKVFSDATAIQTDYASDYSLIITGNTSTETIKLDLWSDFDDFKTGKTFSVSPGGFTESIIEYGPTSNIRGNDAYRTDHMDYPVTEKFDCTITQLTSTYVRGTFSGYIYKNDSSPTPERIDITDGTFYAKF